MRPAALPSLRVVQSIVHHYHRTRLGGSDKRKAIVEAVRRAAFSGREDDHDVFTFTSDYDESGMPVAGNGSDARPFLVGMATKALLWNAVRDPGTFVLDAYTRALMAWRCASLAKLRERSRGLSSELVALVFRSMYDLHFSQNEAEFCERKERMLALWDEHVDLATFSVYVKEQWLQGNFKNWQCYHTPTGYPTTNNPVEQFNRALKQDYTHHHQLKMGLLLAQLLACCGHRSMALPQFLLRPTCPATLKTRTCALRRRGLFQEHVVTRASIDYLLGDADPELVYVRAVAPARTFTPELNRTRENMAISAELGVHYARMEVEGQPHTGWPVNLRNAYCPCRYHMKMGYCCHLLFAQQSRSVVD
ncbi:hypothetical protein PC116_g16543 [Phytophthora cactorum]|nr:hypothetical protein PC119_g16403 [Phytophthora cactorum]KAG3059588.1 hypothetical protein PC122_g20262 [Phytophthora cactorum]KAG3157747.1 hypothetical protein C6341_g14660 [Phytophthora cactorum]KAG4235324.1 hypothetical protein PC116_g16543 [Phytophthora cactorum]